MEDMALQTAFPHPFNLPPILKPCVTKEKSLAALSNAEQVMATLETTTDPQFLQKTYPALVEKKYKHVSTSSTCAPNMRTTAKSSAISQTPYMPDILGTKQGIAALSKFLKRSGAFTKSGTGLPRWKPPTMEDSLAAEHDMEDPEDD